jgi:hypothetical protein
MRGIVLAVGLVTLILGSAYWITRAPVEIAEGLEPDPIDPFGPASPQDLVFRWALPSDGVPVRVEVLDASVREPPLWVSAAVEGGSLPAPRDVVGAWPRGNLYWRPVAIAADGSKREGPLAAFLLLP